MSLRDLAGTRFGRLVSLAYAGDSRWSCQCDCGKLATVESRNLLTGNTKSCGCLSGETRRARFLVHGQTGSAEHRAWSGLKDRCLNPDNKSYGRYGARGVTVCDRWARSFEAFLADVGPRPSARHSIERADNSRGYEPANCAWATRSEQARNRRSNRVLSLGGETMTVIAWSEKTGLDPKCIYARLKRGWSVERVLTQPCRKIAKAQKRSPGKKVRYLSREKKAGA